MFRLDAMNTAADRRAAYRWVADAITARIRASGAHPIHAIELEVDRIQDAMAEAASVEDGPGVAEHVGGNGRQPTPCPRNPDGVHRRWHDESGVDLCMCGLAVP